MIKVDQSTRGGGVVEPGFYGFKVTNFTKKPSKSSDAENAFMSAVVVTADDDALLGVKVVDNFPLLEQSIWRIDAFYQAAMGEEIPEGDYDEEELFEILKSTIGADFKAEATVDTYQGVKRNRLQNFSS